MRKIAKILTAGLLMLIGFAASDARIVANDNIPGAVIQVVHEEPEMECFQLNGPGLNLNEVSGTFNTAVTFCVRMNVEDAVILYLAKLGDCEQGALLFLDVNDETHYLVVHNPGPGMLAIGPDGSGAALMNHVHEHVDLLGWDKQYGHELVRFTPALVGAVDLEYELWEPVVDEENAGLPC